MDRAISQQPFTVSIEDARRACSAVLFRRLRTLDVISEMPVSPGKAKRKSQSASQRLLT
ncbi:hypothetical protein [Halioxenophilus aromaticivorans]|uniref:hypothetical protein n=1 Tax=Halioxenophilus aromaticivorans TaxID=1306992 RepID=UPI0031F1B408